MTTRALVLENFIPFRLSFTSNLVSDTIAQTYEVLFGLTIPEWRLVAVVAEHDGITQQAIGRLTRMDKVVVSRAAAALVDRGLLARAAHPGDKRSHHLRLTDTGRELHAAIAPKALALEEAIFTSFAPDELAQLAAMLRRIDAVTLAMRGEG